VARSVATCAAMLFLLSIILGPATTPLAGRAVVASSRDASLYRGIAAEVGKGRPYYEALAQAHRAQGYPLKPVMTVRLPTLAWISGALGPEGARLLILTLAIFTLGAWFFVLRVSHSLGATGLALTVMTISIIPMTLGSLPLFHESWAALLIALALALWRRDAPWLSIGIALGAALLREMAMPFLVMMALLAGWSRDWKEVAGWVAALALWGIAYSNHAAAVLALARPGDLVSPGWSGLHGWPLLVEAITKTTPLSFLPVDFAGPLTLLSLLGWMSTESGRGLRVTGWLLGMAVMIMIFARPDNFYWATMLVPLLLAGLAFLPSAGTDLWVAARPPRRATGPKVRTS
jgi:hypothetical protein